MRFADLPLSPLLGLRLSLARIAAAIALAGTVAFMPAPSRAADFDAAQKEAIGKIVREFLIANPEVIQEAVAELERRQADAQKTAQASALKETSTALLKSPHGTLVGNPAGDITLVEFFDYNCGYCKRALTDMQTLAKSDPKLRIVLKDFPVLGPESLEASKIALAVKQQISGDKLFDYHAKLLASRGRVNGERALAVAKEMGLDLARLKVDSEGAEVKAALAENASLGEKLSINGTPAFIVGDEVISGAVGLEPLRQAVAGVRQCGHAVC